MQSVALIPQCAECEAVWLPADSERWRAYLGGDDLDAPAELAERAGHARASMSLDVYSHVMPPDEVAAEPLQNLIDDRR